MKNPKENIIILTYGILIYQFISGEGESVFVYLLSVLMELILVVFLYVFTNSSFSFDSISKNFRILFTTFIFGLFNFALIYMASLEFDDLKNISGMYSLSISTPFIQFRNHLILIFIGIVVAYALEYRKIKKQKTEFLISQWLVFRHGIKMWSLMGITVAILVFFPKEYYPVAISLLPIGRILLEFFETNRSTLE